MAWGEAVLVRVGIVGSWWLMDDAIHALFASEAKRFLRACGGFVNLRIWARAQGPPIGAGSLQGRSKPANLPVSGWWARKALEMPIGNSKVQGTTCCPGDHLRKICRRSAACAARREILPIGMVSAVVSCQWRSWLHPRCKFALWRLLL